MKIVHLPTDLGHRAYSLCRAERELGLDSWMIVKSKSVHESGWVHPLNSSNPFLYNLRLLAASYKSFQADVLMANCGQSLIELRRFKMDLFDIPIYDLLNRRIIVTYQGCDVRLCETCPVRVSLPLHTHCSNVGDGSYQQCDQLKLKRFKIWARHADAILGITPDLCLLPGIQYSPHAKYIDMDISGNHNTKIDSKVRICHMSRRHIGGQRKRAVEYLKGTPLIEEQIRAVIERYPKDVEYFPIEDMPWRQCLNVIASCNVIVDQIISGWYGGISVEAALLGTLPIAYIDPTLIRYLPKEMQGRLPVLALGDKGDLENILTGLIQNRERIIIEASRCHENALFFHDARKVAKKLIEEYYI